MLSVARLVSFWRCIPVQYNCQKSSNFQDLSHFSRIFGKNDKIPGFFQAGKSVTIFPGFPGAVGTLLTVKTNILRTKCYGHKISYAQTPLHSLISSEYISISKPITRLESTDLLPGKREKLKSTAAGEITDN